MSVQKKRECWGTDRCVLIISYVCVCGVVITRSAESHSGEEEKHYSYFISTYVLCADAALFSLFLF